MQARLFSRNLALIQMSFQVKFLASRGENSKEMFMQDTSTAFSYRAADAFQVDAASMESYAAGLIDEKLTEIFATACLKKRPLKQENTATGANFILVPGKNVYVNEFIIRDLDKMCSDLGGQRYASADPRLTRKIYKSLQKAYPAGYPENFPKLNFSVEDGKYQLRVIGTKEQIILFTDALIAIANKKEIAPVVTAEEKDVQRNGLNK